MKSVRQAAHSNHVGFTPHHFSDATFCEPVHDLVVFFMKGLLLKRRRFQNGALRPGPWPDTCPAGRDC
jgi:hypothetical protein